MPSYSFNSTIQSIIQLIINFFEKLFGITRGQPIKTQLPPNVVPLKTIGKYYPPPSNIKIIGKYYLLPSNIIKNKNTKISSPKLPILPLPIITRHNVNIENPPKISQPKLPILSIKIIPNKPLSQVLNSSKTNNTSSTNTSTSSTNTSTSSTNTSTSSTNTSTSSTNTSTSSTNTSTSSTNLSQIAINPNVLLSQTLTQGRTIIPAKHKNPNPKGNR